MVAYGVYLVQLFFIKQRVNPSLSLATCLKMADFAKSGSFTTGSWNFSRAKASGLDDLNAKFEIGPGI